MPKLLRFEEEARQSLAQGVHILSLAVRGTLGPKGKLAVMDRLIGKPAVSNDGISIANEIEVLDRFQNMGIQLAREAAFQTNEVAGDGTTTSMILADALIQHAQPALDEGINSVDLTRQLELWGKTVQDIILSQCFALDGQNALEAVARIAAGDETLGQLVAEILTRLGVESHIELEPHFGPDTIQYHGGMQFDRGYISHHLVTNPKRMTIEMTDVALLFTDQKLSHFGTLDALIEQAVEQGHDVLLIAEDYDEKATAHIVALNESSLRHIAAIRAPEFGPWRKMALEDLAIFTGGRFLARDLSLSPDEAEWTDLGFAGHVVVTQDRITMTDGHGSPDIIQGRQNAIREQLAYTQQPFERDKLEERLTRLAGNTAVLLVGGLNTVEQKERLQRAEDAINAAKHALQDGVVLGGGISYVHAAMKIKDLALASRPDTKEWARQILCRALEEPLRTLAENSGLSPETVLAHIDLESYLGLNALNAQLEDLREARILDSVTSVIQALVNALSIAKMVLTTSVLISDTLDAPDPTQGPARGGGGEALGMH